MEEENKGQENVPWIDPKGPTWVIPEGSPIWISPTLHRHLDEFVRRPFEHPELYNETWIPIHFCQGIFGRHGLGIRESVDAILAQLKVHSVRVLDLKANVSTRDALNILDIILTTAEAIWQDAANAAQGRLVYEPLHVIVINNADNLCFAPDVTQETLEVAVKIGERAKKSHTIVLGICNRLMGSIISPSNEIRRLQEEFFMQFNSVGYAACPNDEFRIKYFNFCIHQSMKHLEQNAGYKVELQLSMENYEELKNVTGWATLLNIRNWVMKIFSFLILNPSVIVIDWPLLTKFLSNKSGVPHICEYDTCKIESEFSTACEQGTIVNKRKQQEIQRLIERKNAAAPPNATGFVMKKDAADFDQALAMLNGPAPPPTDLDPPPHVEEEEEDNGGKKKTKRKEEEEVNPKPAPTKRGRKRK